jgi:hypothetical protein
MIKDYFFFLKTPSISLLRQCDIGKKIRTIIGLYFFTLGFLMLSVGIREIVEHFLILIFHLKSFDKTLLQNEHSIKIQLGKYGAFMAAVVFAPIIEEIIFRLPLNTKGWSISLSIGFLLYSCLGFKIFYFNFLSIYSYLKIVSFLIILPLIINWLFTKYNLQQRIIQHYKLFFYLMIVVFALAHISNYAPIDYRYIYIYPIFVLPQFVMGLTLGYIRNKFGLPYSILLHSVINLPGSLLILIS